MLKEFVNFVAKHLRLTNMSKQHVVQNHVEEHCHGKRVKYIQKIGNDDVYCMEVPKTHNFIANGMVVHNSVDALRYAVYTHFFGKDGARLSAQDLDRLYREAQGGGFDLPSTFIPPEQVQGFLF